MSFARSRRGPLAALVALLVVTLSGCGLFIDEPDPVVSIDALQGNTSQVILDPGFVAALGQLGLSPGTTGRARLRSGKLVFPISGGNITLFKPGRVSPYVIGQIQHVGTGFTLTGGGTTVGISNLNIDPGVSRVYGDVTVNGRRAATSAYVFALDGRSLQPLDVDGRRGILQGTKVRVSDDAAALLNSAFSTSAVQGGLLVGTAKIVVKLPRDFSTGADLDGDGQPD